MDSMSVSENLIRIINCILAPDACCDEFFITDWNALITYARKNGVFQYVYRYMKQLEDDKKPAADVIAAMDGANMRNLRMSILQECALEKLRAGLEDAGINHLFMKGSVTKERYPDRYLRSMGDIDFLYDPAQHDLLCKAMNDMGFVLKNVGRVHDLYIDNNKIIMEAHRQMVSSSSPYIEFSNGIWSRAEATAGYEHNYSMKLEDEFLFSIMHLASHFKKGGIGIRFIVDVWIYKNLEMDWEYIHRSLSAFGLNQFYDIIDSLAEKWFGKQKTEDALIAEIEQYILSGGVFGCRENQKNSAIRNGKLKYFLKVCFPGFEEMRSMFPWLTGRWMLPFAWIRRGLESILKRRKNISVLLSPLKESNADSAAELKNFFVRCGLE